MKETKREKESKEKRDTRMILRRLSYCKYMKIIIVIHPSLVQHIFFLPLCSI